MSKFRKGDVTRESFKVLMFDLNYLELKDTEENNYHFELLKGNLDDIFGMNQKEEIIPKKIEKFVDSISELWDGEPLDGDDTEKISKLVLKELNERNGNK